MNAVSAVICELNPLHKGHEYIFKKAREHGDAIVAVMSGNFVQRGECAVFDKYVRARAALAAGCDLVLELPFPWSAAPAEFFASAAMRIVSSVGASHVVFGSECGELSLIKNAASLMSDVSFLAEVERLYSGSEGYAAAREKAALSAFPEVSRVFSSPNDMLAAEYIKNAENAGYKGDFFCAPRRESDGYIGAGGIRRLILGGEFENAKKYMPSSARDIFSESYRDVALPSKLFDLEMTLFRARRFSERCFDSKSGIVERIKKCADMSGDGGEMLRRAATKKYTDARLRRAALFAVADVGESALREPPRFTVLLSANGKGRDILKQMQGGPLRVVTKPSRAGLEPQYDLAVFADRIYTMCCESVKDASYFLRQAPVII